MDLPDMDTDPDSDYDTDLEGELNESKREISNFATRSENEHLYQEYKKQCKRYQVVPQNGLKIIFINDSGCDWL